MHLHVYYHLFFCSVIVSQWTKMLEIVAVHLGKLNIRCSVIRGDIPAKKRMEYVDQFNNDKHGPEVMLVSLRAGGCGLNLIGGNHLFLLDSHWYRNICCIFFFAKI